MDIHDILGPSGFWRLRYCRGLGGELRRQGIDWNAPESRVDTYGGDPWLSNVVHAALAGRISVDSRVEPETAELIGVCERLFSERVGRYISTIDPYEIAEDELALAIPLKSGFLSIGTLDRLRGAYSRAVVCDWKLYRDYRIPYDLARWQSFVYAYGVFSQFPRIENILGLVVNPYGEQALEIEFHRADMSAMRDVISGGYEDFERDDLEPTPGAHCHGCPALASCRAHKRAMRVRTAYSSLGLERRTDGGLSIVDDAKLYEAWHAIKIARRRADQFEAWIKEALHAQASTALKLKMRGGKRSLARSTWEVLPVSVREMVSRDAWDRLSKKAPLLSELRKEYVDERVKEGDCTRKAAAEEFDADMESAGLIERGKDSYMVEEV